VIRCCLIMLRTNQFLPYEVIIKRQVVAICDAVLEANLERRLLSCKIILKRRVLYVTQCR